MGPSGGASMSSAVFQPPGQAEAANMLSGLFNPLYNTAISGQTPGAWAYPQAQSYVPTGNNVANQWLVPGTPGTPASDAAGLAYGTATNAYNNYLPLYGDLYNQIPGLTAGAAGGLDYLPQVMGNAFSPYYGGMVGATADNPLYPQAMTGAAQGAAYGARGAQNMMNQAGSIYSQGFDPQAALYGRSQQQLLDKSNAVNAMSGVAGSPYGASTTANALGNFDINWENQQLQRQMQAAQATSPLYSGATNLAYGSAQLPNQVYMKQIGDVLAALAAQNQAGAQGASAYGSLLGASGQGLGQANNLSTGLTQALTSIGGQPYTTGATIGGNAQTSLGNQMGLLGQATQLGNQQFALPQMLIQDLMSYLTGGRAAAMDSANIGNMGFNQTASGIGGLLGGANTLFGRQGIMPLFGSVAAAPATGGLSLLGAPAAMS